MRTINILAIKVICGFIFFTIFYFMPVSLFGKDKKEIFILNSYHNGYHFSDDIIREEMKIVESKYPNSNFYIEYMDTKRFQMPNYFEFFKEFYELKYENRKFDIILSTDDNALLFLLKYHNELFQDIPVVFSGINNYDDTLLVGKEKLFTGVLEVVEVENTLNIALKIHPQTERVFVICDETSTGIDLKNNFIEDIEPKFKSKLKIIYLENISKKELLNKLKELPKENSIIFYLSFFKQEEGIASHIEAVKIISQECDIPIYISWDVYFGSGAVGGMITSGVYNGKVAGEIALRVLDGEKIESIPIVKEGQNKFMFDYNQLKRFNISKNRLPKDSIIINNPPPFYEEYRVLFQILLMGIVLLIMIIIPISVYIIKKKQFYNEIKRKDKELEQKVSERTKELEIINSELKRKNEELISTNFELEDTLLQLKEAQNVLITQEKMTSLGNIVAGVAHEINTPIGIGLTASSFLEQQVSDYRNLYRSGNMKRSDFEKHLKTFEKTSNIIFSNLKRAAGLIKSFKQVAIDQTTELKRTFNVKKYFSEMLLTLQPNLKKRQHKVIINCDEKLEINSYPGLYFQIITNLIMNSVVHGFENIDNGEITINIENKNNKLIIEYKDNGKGIKESIVPKIFEPFFTTKFGVGRSGLGLNLVYNIITQQLKGKIECNSKPNCGVTFLIEIPVENGGKSE